MAVFENKTLAIQSCFKIRFPLYKTITTLFEKCEQNIYNFEQGMALLQK